MRKNLDNHLTRIGVFYDGNYFYHVSNYYYYTHPRHTRISVQGLHEFIREQVSIHESESTDYDHTQIVDAHYFRGRLAAREANQRGNVLYYDRLFDDILTSQGITTHYMPVKGSEGRKEEKNVGVWLALETYELAIYKQFDVVVLVTCDGDYIPLIRKLLTLGIRVMLLAWDFEYQDDMGNIRITKTSQELIAEATYPLMMNYIIGEEASSEDESINSLFVPQANKEDYGNEEENGNNDQIYTGEVLSMKKGYGFIRHEPNNLFFHYSKTANGALGLNEGDKVRYRLAKNQLGTLIATDVESI